MTELRRIENKIEVVGDLQDFHYLLALIHLCIGNTGYSDVVLDLSECTSAFQNSMLSICAQVMAYRKAGIDFELIPPNSPMLFNLFKNTN